MLVREPPLITNKWESNFNLKLLIDCLQTTSAGKSFHKAMMRMSKNLLLCSFFVCGFHMFHSWPLNSFSGWTSLDNLKNWVLSTFSRPCISLKTSIRSPRSRLSFRVVNPNSFSLFSYGSSFRDGTSLVALCWTCSKRLISFSSIAKWMV